MPPEARAPGSPASAAQGAPAVLVLQPLRKRADFLRLARGRRRATPAFILQAMPRHDAGDGTAVRVGFTCSRKVGNAVARNRARRRLREAARAVLPLCARPGWDYVLIGRAEVTAMHPFEDLKNDLRAALARVHEAAT